MSRKSHTVPLLQVFERDFETPAGATGLARRCGRGRHTSGGRRRSRLGLELLECRCTPSANAGVATITSFTVKVPPHAVYGQPVTLTATVVTNPAGLGPVTGGSVTFNDGSLTLGSAPVSNGTATLTTSLIPAGSSQITAAYSGDGANFAASTPQVVNVVAGGGPPPSGLLHQSAAVAFDANDNLYFDDGSSVRERKPDGTLITIAGNGTYGFSGDGGPATQAQIGYVGGLALDRAGNLYIADPGNSRVRMVTPSGIISTIAGNGNAGYSGDGGPAVNAEFDDPVGVATDSNGNLFIVDAYDSVVRKVAPDGIITTIAGDGYWGYSGDGGPAVNAEFAYPICIAADANGNLFIGDLFNSVVRKITTAGIITTVAGNGTGGNSGDGGAATKAEIESPYGLAVNAAGSLFIADGGNSNVREVKLDGTIVTFAGNGNSAFGGDGGPATKAELSGPDSVAFDSHGNLVIADPGNSAIREVNTAGTIHTILGGITAGNSGNGGPATSANLQNPNGLAVDGAGNIYIADSWNNVVRKVTPDGTIATVAGTALPSGDYDDATGPATEISLSVPTAVAVDGQGDLFIADSANNVVREVTPDGIMKVVAGTRSSGYSGDDGPATRATLSSPRGLAVDSHGNLFIADSGNNAIREVTTTGTITTAAGDGNSGYFGDGGPARAAQFSYPEALAFDAEGNLFIADTFNNVVREIRTDGTIFTVAGNPDPYADTEYGGDGGPAVQAQLNFPLAVAVDRDGNLFIADSFNNVVREVTPDGTISTAAGAYYDAFGSNSQSTEGGDGGLPTNATFYFPEAVAFDPNGNLLIGDSGNNLIREVSTSSSPVTIGVAKTVISLANSAQEINLGQPLTFTATVKAVAPSKATPDGTITFLDGSTVLATVGAGADGVASFSISSLTAGAHSITAVYAGNANLLGSTSGALFPVVDQPGTNIYNTTTVLSSSANPSGIGQSVRFLAQVRASGGTAIPTGSLTFEENGVPIASATLDSAGAATFSSSTLNGGSHTITAVYGGDATDQPSASNPLTQVVKLVNTITSMSVSLLPATYGQSVRFTVHVAQSLGGSTTPTGTVSFESNENVLGTATLNDTGAAVFTTSSLPAGTYPIVAVYQGDAINQSSESQALIETIRAVSTTTNLSTSATVLTVQKPVTLTAIVVTNLPEGAVPVGSVTFLSDGGSIGTAKLNGSGIASLTTSELPLGTHTLNAVYDGDTNNAGSSSNATTAVVAQRTSTSLKVSQSAASAGAPITLTATVSVAGSGSAPLTGTVTFEDGMNILGFGTLDDHGVATLVSANLPLGNHQITAYYVGDSYNLPSTSSASAVTIKPAPIISVTSSVLSPVFGKAITFTATVKGSNVASETPSGTVLFMEGTKRLGTATLTDGVARWTSRKLTAGTHSITAVYQGDSHFGGGSAPAMTVKIRKGATTTTLAPMPSHLSEGQSIVLTATVRAKGPASGSPTGALTFFDGSKVLGTASIVDGTATLRVKGLALGARAISAKYEGDSNFASGTSAIASITISGSAPNAANGAATRTTLAASSTSVRIGESITLTAIVRRLDATDVRPSGTVTFEDSGRILGAASLDDGTATLNSGPLSKGRHTLTAVYDGNGGRAKSQSTTVNITVSGRPGKAVR